MASITAVIPALNEEKNIARCIESVKWCNKIIVMWMGDDQTGEVARKMGAEVIEMNKSGRNDFIAVQKNINWAIDHCKTDWILRIDADETVTPELEKEMRSIIASGIHNCPVAYGIPRRQFFNGSFLKGGDWVYDRLIRFFRPKYVRYNLSSPVHEQFIVNGEIDYCKYPLNHYSHPTLNDARKKFQSYTDIEARNLNIPVLRAILNMIFLPVYVFLRWMIWHKGYRDGLRGIIAGGYRGWYEYLLYSKYIRLHSKI